RLSLPLFAGHDDAQRFRPYPVAQRGLQDRNLSVARDPGAAGPRLDRERDGSQRLEIPGGAQPAEESANRQEQEAARPRPRSEVERELAPVDPIAAADIEALDLVRVVSDEDERSASPNLAPVDREEHVERRVAVERVNGRPDERGPLSPFEPHALLVPVFHDPGIKTEARVVHEDPAVDLSDVDADDAAFDDGPRRGLRIRRDLQVLREMVERSERDDSERLFT